jgi:hypothetical protein
MAQSIDNKAEVTLLNGKRGNCRYGERAISEVRFSVNNRNFMVLTTASYSVPWECYGGFAKEEGGASAAYVSY